MGDLWLKVVPRREADLARLKETILDKDLGLARTGYERAIERDPRDFEALSRRNSLHIQDVAWTRSLVVAGRADRRLLSIH